mgnify:CR=1 FL=1
MKMQNKFKRIAIKIGSNVLAQSDGSLNVARISHLVDQISGLIKNGTEVIVISSGAVAAGRGEVAVSRKTELVAAKQLWAAIGQVKLMSLYTQLFGERGMHCAQVLTTKENFSDRRHYLNMKNCITTMLENNVIPIVNENDTISVTELMFTDNDELSGLIASMMNCDSLFILSNIDGVYTGAPDKEGSELIREIDSDFASLQKYIAPTKSGFGRGGMLTKCSIAAKIASEGINVYIANGTKENTISDIVSNKLKDFTHFLPHHKTTSVKKWLAHSQSFTKGYVTINKGAAEALLSDKANSLLFIGITGVEGTFEKGDIVGIYDSDNQKIGIGKAMYDSQTVVECMGKKQNRPFVHYDYLVLNEI